jgi:hypothetical protein
MYDDGAVSGATNENARGRDGGAGSHVRDGMEKHFAQADRVAAEAGRRR